MENKKLTRRSFLKSAAIGTAGLAAAGLVGCSANNGSATDNVKWDHTTDVVIIGSGALFQSQ